MESPIRQSRVGRARRWLRGAAIGLYAAIATVGVLLPIQSTQAEVQFPDPSGIYEGFCVLLGDTLYDCDDIYLERFDPAPHCPDTLIVQTTGFSPSGAAGVPSVQVSGQWLACNYYYPSRWIAETMTCSPPSTPAFHHVSTGTYRFDAEISWQTLFHGLSAPTTMNLVRPSAAALQSTYTAPVQAQVSNSMLMTFGTRTESINASEYLADWADGTVYTTRDQFGARDFGPGGCTLSSFKNLASIPTRYFAWQQVSGASPETARADLTGFLASLLPQVAPDITRATVNLYSQPNGPVRADRLGNETPAEFRDYLDENLVLLDAVELTTDENGEFLPFAEPGKFVFASLPVFKRSGKSGTRQLYREQVYAIEVINALGEVETSGPGGTETKTHPFEPKVVTNLRLSQPAVTVELLPHEGPVPVKRNITQDLADRCMAYNLVETDVLTYLNNLESGVITMTDEREEGVERAILAERAVLMSTRLAEESVKEAYDTLAGLVGDLIGDLKFSAEGNLAEASEAFDKIQAQKQKAGSFWNGVSTSEIEGVIKDRGQAARFKQGQFAGALDKAMSLAAPFLTDTLIENGMDEVDARRITAAVTKGIVGIPLKMVEADGFNSRAALKAIVTEVIKTVGDDTLNQVCSLLEDDLAYASAQMQGWSDHNEGELLSDRNNFYDGLSLLSDAYSSARADAAASKEIAQGFDNAENVFGILSVGFKPAKAAEELSMLSKYTLNLRALLADVAASFATIKTAEDLVFHAFNEAPRSGQAQAYAQAAQPAAAPLLATASIPDLRPELQALLADIDSMIVTLDGPSVENAVTAMFAGDQSLIAKLDHWQQQLERLNLEFQGISTDSPAINEAIAAFLDRQADYDFFRQSLNRQIRAYVEATIEADDAGVATVGYRIARDKLAAALEIFRDQLSPMDIDLLNLNIYIPSISAGTIRPAVHLTLDSVVSQATGLANITQTPETFTITATARNLSDGDLQDLAVNLVVSTGDDVTFVSPATQVVGLLSADGSGAGSEATVSWDVAYSGSLDDSNLKLLYANLREDGDVPTTFVANAAMALWHVEPDVFDSDLDGFSNAFENANGMDPNVPNTDPDIDNDGLDNDKEARLGTDPARSDTDGDGLDDFSELFGAETGFITDPLDADTDGDGVADLGDPAPIDAYAATPTQVLNETPGVLQADQATVVLSESQIYTGINITQTGTGELLWRAEVEDPGLFQLSVGPGSLQQSPGVLFVAARGDSVDYSRAVRSRILVETVEQAASSQVWIDVMYDGAGGIGSGDEDGDGVTDDVDACPGTPAGETVDANGCSQSQLDDDGDGVSNAVDACPATPAGEAVDANGCSQSQLDDDGDGVSNDIDLCAGTPAGTVVDAAGCPVNNGGGNPGGGNGGGKKGGAGSFGPASVSALLLLLAVLRMARGGPRRRYNRQTHRDVACLTNAPGKSHGF